jgi:hypothetical protein
MINLAMLAALRREWNPLGRLRWTPIGRLFKTIFKPNQQNFEYALTVAICSLKQNQARKGRACEH